MGKQQKEKVQHVRVAKGKSPRQLQKKEANIKAAQERLAKLQEQQKADKLARQQRIADYQAQQLAALDAEKAEAERRAYEQAYVDAALTIYPFKRWLANRVATFDRAQKFFAKAEIKHPFEQQAHQPQAA